MNPPQLNQVWETMFVGRTGSKPRWLFFYSTTTTIPIPTITTTTTTTRSQVSLISYYFSLLHSSPDPKHLRHLHARLLRTSLYDNVILTSKLILMYSTHNHLLPHSYSVFLHMPHRNIYSWNILIGEFSRSRFPEKSVDLFVRMPTSFISPDVYTFPLVLRACASSGMVLQGMLAHGLCIKSAFDKNLFVASALVFLYVTTGKIYYARKVFDQMSQRDAVLWTSMLAGYAQHSEPYLSLGVFREMVNQRVELDEVVMVSLLLICSQLGQLRHGKSVHGSSVRRCLGLGLTLANALVDMYVKCGALRSAYSIFNRMTKRDVITWSALILGYGLNGNVDVALKLFDRMCLSKVKPNDVTFLGVLSACAHAGMVDRALTFLGMMKDSGVMAKLKHYACVVDCFGKAGLLEEAEKFVEEMPVEPDEAVLGALLGGCRVHGNVEVAERIGKKLLELKPEKAGYYVLLANIYTDSGRYNDAEKVRDFMKQINVNKVPGHSLIESGCYAPRPKKEQVLLENG